LSDRDDQAQGDQCHVGLTDITIENKKNLTPMVERHEPSLRSSEIYRDRAQRAAAAGEHVSGRLVLGG
jgi:hypothetical protein